MSSLSPRSITPVCFPNRSSPIYSLLHLDKDLQEYHKLAGKTLSSKAAQAVAQLIFEAVGMCGVDLFLPSETIWTDARKEFLKKRKIAHDRISKLVQGKFGEMMIQANQNTLALSGKNPLDLFKDQFKDLSMPVQMIQILLDNELLPENFHRDYGKYVRGWQEEDQYGTKILFETLLDLRKPLPKAESNQEKLELCKYAQFLGARAALCLRDSSDPAKPSVIYVSWHTLLCTWARKTTKDNFDRVVEFCKLLQLPEPQFQDKHQSKTSFFDYMLEESLKLARAYNIPPTLEGSLRDSMRLNEGVRKKILLALALGKRLELPSVHPRMKSLQYHFKLNHRYASGNPLSKSLFDHDLTGKEWHELQKAIAEKGEEEIALAVEVCEAILLKGCGEEKMLFLPLFLAVLTVKDLKKFSLLLNVLLMNIPFEKGSLIETEKSFLDLIERCKMHEDYQQLIDFCQDIKEYKGFSDFSFPLYYMTHFIFAHGQSKGNFFTLFTALKESVSEFEAFAAFPKEMEDSLQDFEEELLAYYRELFFDYFLEKITKDERDTLKMISIILSRNKPLKITFKMLEEIEKTRSGPKPIDVSSIGMKRGSIAVITAAHLEKKEKEEEKKVPENNGSSSIKTTRRVSIVSIDSLKPRRASIVSANFGVGSSGDDMWGSDSGGSSSSFEPDTSAAPQEPELPQVLTGAIYNDTPSAISSKSYSQSIPHLDLGGMDHSEPSSSLSSGKFPISMSPSITPLTHSRRPSITSPKPIPISPGMGRRNSAGSMSHRRSRTMGSLSLGTPAFAAIQEAISELNIPDPVSQVHVGLTPMISPMPPPSTSSRRDSLTVENDPIQASSISVPSIRAKSNRKYFESDSTVTMTQINLIKFLSDNIDAARVTSAVSKFWDAIGQVWDCYPDLSPLEITSIFLSYFSFRNNLSLGLLDQSNLRQELENNVKLLNDQLKKLEELQSELLNRKLPSSLIFNWLMFCPDLRRLDGCFGLLNLDLGSWDSHVMTMIPSNGAVQNLMPMNKLRHSFIESLSTKFPALTSTPPEVCSRIDAQYYESAFIGESIKTLIQEISYATIPASFQHIFDFMTINALQGKGRNVSRLNSLILLNKNFTKGFSSYVDWELPANELGNPVLVVSALNLTKLEATVSRYPLPWSEKTIKFKPELMQALLMAERELQEENEDSVKRKYSKEVVQFIEMVKKDHDFCIRWLACTRSDKHKINSAMTSALFFDPHPNKGIPFVGNAPSAIVESEKVFTFEKSLPSALRLQVSTIIEQVLNYPFAFKRNYRFSPEDNRSDSSFVVDPSITVEFNPTDNANEITLTIDQVSVKTRYSDLLLDEEFPMIFNWQLLMLMAKVYDLKGYRLTQGSNGQPLF